MSRPRGAGSAGVPPGGARALKCRFFHATLDFFGIRTPPPAGGAGGQTGAPASVCKLAPPSGGGWGGDVRGVLSHFNPIYFKKPTRVKGRDARAPRGACPARVTWKGGRLALIAFLSRARCPRSQADMSRLRTKQSRKSSVRSLPGVHVPPARKEAVIGDYGG